MGFAPQGYIGSPARRLDPQNGRNSAQHPLLPAGNYLNTVNTTAPPRLRANLQCPRASTLVASYGERGGSGLRDDL